MKVGKRLFCCPKCQLPSHVDTKIPSTAECTNATCKYRFCIVCECEEHLHRSCNFISTPIARKPSENIGTAKSRRNLKRLLKWKCILMKKLWYFLCLSHLYLSNYLRKSTVSWYQWSFENKNQHWSVISGKTLNF